MVMEVCFIPSFLTLTDHISLIHTIDILFVIFGKKLSVFFFFWGLCFSLFSCVGSKWPVNFKRICFWLHNRSMVLIYFRFSTICRRNSENNFLFSVFLRTLFSFFASTKKKSQHIYHLIIRIQKFGICKITHFSIFENTNSMIYY